MSLSHPTSAASSRRSSTRPVEDKEAHRHDDDDISPRSSNPASRPFERLINIPGDLVHQFSTTTDESSTDRGTYPGRRRSSLFSLQLPMSRRRLVRLGLLCSLVGLFFLTLTSGSRNRRRSRLIKAAGTTSYANLAGFKWPTWVDAETSSRLSGRASRFRKEVLGGKLRRSLQDLGLNPVYLDRQDDLPFASASSSQRRLSPVTTPPHQVEARQVEEQVQSAQAEESEEEDTMPWFWGNVDKVGSSPFDHWPELDLEAGEKGKRVLFLTDYKDYLERMNTHTYEIVDSAFRHPLIARVDVWGPGWNGWDPDLDLGENVRRRMWRVSELDRVADERERETRKTEQGQQVVGKQREEDNWAGMWKASDEHTHLEETNAEETAVEDGVKMGSWLETIGSVPEGCPAQGFDLVWTISQVSVRTALADEMTRAYPCDLLLNSDIFKQNDKRLTPIPCGALLAQQLGDCHSLNCFKEWYPYTSNITVTKYAFEMLDIFNPERLKKEHPEMSMHLFGHSPDSANQWDFYPGEWSERKHDAQMFGFTGSFYPLRMVVTDAIRDKKDTVINRFEHPGYFVWEDPKAYEDPLETYTVGHPYYTKHTRMRADFAGGLRDTKICVFDSSLERKLIRKYAQAFLSGCVVAGDIPTEHEEALEKFMIKLHPDATIEEIDEILENALLDEEELKRKAFLGFAYARKYLTNTNKLTQMLRLVDKHNEGARGYDLPYGFSLRCRAYWSNDDSHRPPWCQGRRGLEGKPR